MLIPGITPTRDRILNAAVSLFSDRGYCRVSMRDIAQEVGIKAASIYNHFPSKSDILKCLFEYYALQRSLAAPSLDELLLLAETEPAKVVLSKLTYDYPSEIINTMDCILLIASQEISSDEACEQFIHEHLFESTLNLLVPVLERLIELEKVRPIDVNDFSLILIYSDMGAALLNHASRKSDPEKWRRCLDLVFSLIEHPSNEKHRW